MNVFDKKFSLNKFKRIFIGYLILVVAIAGFTSCNFFEVFNPPLPMSEDRGAKAFDDGNYDEALKQYSNALLTDPYNSKARVGYARASFWKFLPDFMILLAAEYPADGSTPPYSVIFGILGSAEGRAAIVPDGNITFYKMIQDVLDSPYGVVNGKGDASIGADSMELNLMLTIAYFFDISLSLLDSDGDGIYGETNGDDMLYYTNETSGKEVIAYNFNFLSLENEVSNMTDMSESNTAAEAWTNFRDGHNMVEDTLYSLKFFYSKLELMDKTLETLIRPSNYLKLITADIYGHPYLGGYANMYDSLQDAATNTNSFSEFVSIFQMSTKYKILGEDGGVMLNSLHNAFVGVYAYPTNETIMLFTESPWDTHNGGLKKAMEDVIAISSNTNLTPEQLSNIEDIITNSFSPEELSNLMGLL